MTSENTCQLPTTRQSQDFGSGQTLSGQGTNIQFSPSFELATSVTITINGAPSNAYSDAHLYFKDAKGNQVLDAGLVAGADKGSSITQTFILPAASEIASVDCFSWWNSVQLQSLVISYIPTSGTATTPNLASQQLLWGNGVQIATPGCNYVTSASYTVTGVNGTACMHLYFADAAGNRVGDGALYPNGNQQASGVYNFPTPVQVASIGGYSWWNPATLNSLTLTYLDGQ